MHLGRSDKKIIIPNMLLIAGNGRNVGKTFLACKFIEQISRSQKVIGVKFSSHIHPVEKKDIIIETKDFVIVEENKISNKDSSMMLQAGASKVYFVMAKKRSLKTAFLQLNKLLPDTAIVCESGGLAEFINPGVFLFVKKTGDEIIRKDYLRFSPEIVENSSDSFGNDISNINFTNNRFSLRKI
jgi:hypothetical protein